MNTRVYQVVVGTLVAVVVSLGTWSAITADVASSPSRDVARGDAMSVLPSIHEASAGVDPPADVQLRSALEGLDTTEYRMTMMMCVDE